MNPVQDDPQWSVTTWEGRQTYSRPLVASELLSDQYTIFQDGTTDCCQGHTFTSPLPRDEIVSRLKDGIGRLRFSCPLIAAAIQKGVHDPQFRSWIYTPISNRRELDEWIEETVIVHPDPLDGDAFLAQITYTRLPYVLPSGKEKIFRCYFVEDPEDESKFSILWHGPHAIMDAWPTFHAFRIMLEAMSKTNPDPLDSLSWGTEWSNLPSGPVTSTGGPRPNWETEGRNLTGKVFQMLMNPVPTLSILPQRTEITVRGRQVRARKVLDETTSAKLVQAARAAGFSVSHLFEAAQALAIMYCNAITEDAAKDAHVTYPVGIISAERFRVPPYNRLNHFVSEMIHVPIQVKYADVVSTDLPKDRILTAAKSIKKQYDDFMMNAHIPHLTAAVVKLAPPREPMVGSNPYATVITNLGVIDRLLPVIYYPDGNESKTPVFEVLSLTVGHRLIAATPTTQVFSMKSQLTVQIETNDLWDQSYMQEFVDDVVRQALNILT